MHAYIAFYEIRQLANLPKKHEVTTWKWSKSLHLRLLQKFLIALYTFNMQQHQHYLFGNWFKFNAWKQYLCCCNLYLEVVEWISNVGFSVFRTKDIPLVKLPNDSQPISIHSVKSPWDSPPVNTHFSSIDVSSLLLLFFDAQFLFPSFAPGNTSLLRQRCDG